ncbi:fatty acid synthase subunit alpha reductase [Fusarium beomiforme]|uniref:beta-ketoacyl-[acyl-carrier-protein] synthase I n=1 Tax=Fusarium beomiforme TaxID=44412 RepID=A0A9P5A7Q5_9HYPO|nr:fatty acid synthase subunit alpha reductase [Fusarium beomiforme]
MHPDVEQKLAHTLLVELLAHQFAYPVRWVETQDVILGEVNAERIVEVGPSPILTNMMKRTFDASFANSDEARNINRQFLAPQTNNSEIYYQYNVTEESDQVEPVNTLNIETQPKNTTQEVQKPLTVPNVSYSQVEKISDVNVPVSAILVSLLALKLKKKQKSIPMTGTISNLVGGRSTLSNEIVGDLLVEFPHGVPDKPEEVPLNSLSQTLTISHHGKLGKVTTSLIAKMISSKLPGGYGLSKARQHLREKWGLGQNRQDAALLLALSRQPTNRLSSSADANRFLDEISSLYFEQENLTIPSRGPVRSEEPVVDAQALILAREQSASLLRDIKGVMEAHIDSAKEVKDAKLEEPDTEATVTEKLDMWIAEHGDDYAQGIMPIFDPKKQRIYDSYWNWNAQDIMRLFQKLRSGGPTHIQASEQLSMSIVNRTCARTLEQLGFIIAQVEKEPSTDAGFREAVQILRQACLESLNLQPLFINLSPKLAPLTTIDRDGNLVYSEISRNPCPKKLESTREVSSMTSLNYPVSRVDGVAVNYSQDFSKTLAQDLKQCRQSGLSFSGKNVLVTGAGKNSIGNHILHHLLSGGARVTVTTSSFSEETTTMFQSIYARHGSKGSVLRLVPFNQGSHGDVQNLIKYMYTDTTWDLDFIVPFAAISENGRGIEDIDSKSEIAHRAMLTNLVRLLGAVASQKRQRDILTRPATVVLPLSPNHGLMGNDGLYSESKISLEALLPKWSSESWADYMSLMGVIIGWTRGTSLMDDNDVVAQAVESLGVRTFSSVEIAADIVSLMGGSLNFKCQEVPLVVDMSGGLGKIQNFKEKLMNARRELHAYADLQRLALQEIRRDVACVTNQASTSTSTVKPVRARANILLPLPEALDYEADIAPLATSLNGMVDLSRVVVITGFAELGPHGSSRTRWEMEKSGTLALEGCVEMAWLMGLIKHHSGVDKNGNQYSGWIDTKTSNPVSDDEIPGKYFEFIAKHSGIRRIEPENCDNGYDPEHKESLIEVVLQRDLAPFEASPDTAESIQRQHGNRATIIKDATGNCQVQLKAGATLMVPRAARFNRTVAGQIPTGWTAKQYGISDEIIEQVDPVTLFSIVCTVEALLCSGIIDPYEFYKHMHVSEFGNCLGSSMGGLSSLRRMHRDRYIDKPVKSDILQETFINTTGAWINMLLSSSAGPIRTPVGACATSIESLDTACDLITLKKAKVCLVGGVEDFVEDVSYEFGSMKATCDTDAEIAAGWTPKEMSRPTASSRSGFVESQGCGIQVLTSAELAFEMGLPIFGIVAYTNMAADKSGRSVPAPGKGVLTNAREKTTTPSPMLSLNYRKRLLDLRRTQIYQAASDHLDILKSEICFLRDSETADHDHLESFRASRERLINEDAERQDKEATFNLGNQFWMSEDTGRISPIRGSLAVWGLSIDDISVASLHGTSTVQNDLNEPMVIQEQMRHLGRSNGNLLPCVCQKWLTGHSKGAAGSWMVNGCLQMMCSGLIPGNRNVDNVEAKLQEHHHLVFPNTTLQTDEIKACSVTSFGFGQKGAQALLVHPRYLLATIGQERYHDYIVRRNKRWNKACFRLSDAMVRNDMVSACIKDRPPYSSEAGVASLLDPMARF